MIVLDDADLDQAAAAASFGSFMNSGQICMSTEKIIVAETVADAFMQKLRDRMSGLVAGDPAIGGAPLGSMADSAAAARITSMINDAVSKGARLYEAAPARGTLLSAAVLDAVTPDMQIYAQESFGPVVLMLRAKDDEGRHTPGQ